MSNRMLLNKLLKQNKPIHRLEGEFVQQFNVSPIGFFHLMDEVSSVRRKIPQLESERRERLTREAMKSIHSKMNNLVRGTASPEDYDKFSILFELKSPIADVRSSYSATKPDGTKCELRESNVTKLWIPYNYLVDKYSPADEVKVNKILESDATDAAKTKEIEKITPISKAPITMGKGFIEYSGMEPDVFDMSIHPITLKTIYNKKSVYLLNDSDLIVNLKMIVSISLESKRNQEWSDQRYKGWTNAE